MVAAGAFLLPALSLVVPSGYSWGALCLAMAGLLTAVCARTQPVAWAAPWFWWLGSIALMGLVWLLRLDWGGHAMGSGAFDRFAKYVSALVAAIALVRFAPSLTWTLRGCWLGAWGAAAVASWQMHAMGLERAHGYLNAIQFGNVAVLLALWSALAALRARSRWERWAAGGAVLAGIYASLLSGTRGGWWVLGAWLAVLVWAGWRGYLPSGRTLPAASRPRARRAGILAALAALAVGGGLIWAATAASFHQRLQDLQRDLQHYEQGEASTSVGHRLAHWRLAWQMGWERPGLGWSEAGYEQRKREWVASGQAPAVVLRFGHVHHEWLDLWAKAGALGVLALALFYGIPAAIYVRHLRPWRPDDDRVWAAWAGLILVSGYLGFGMTQVLFAHNSGNLVYLFMNLVWVSMVLRPTVMPDER
ncbi:MAG: O-antigen ligase family protein [Tepidimonas sp.]|uniref:O-antigen ligase family protein n=1 Tax=Tepidimonas sp. TaxID=2002775 RepID=UPI00259D979B|nr:O-antigen ligase family protein [Tepidimonas sp.]MDM7456993.1 O-antigen ligase family protein [Tepidimonas sp.]